MNTATLTSGSIVMWQKEICQIVQLKEKSTKVSIRWHNPVTDAKEIEIVDLSDLQPVPITPQLLECFGLKRQLRQDDWKFRYYKTDRIEIRLMPFSRFAFRLRVFNLFTYQMAEDDYRKGRSRRIEINESLKHFYLHDLQYFLKGIEGLNFEITLEQLKGYKI